MNEVTNFMYYMFNKWSLGESVNIFGNDLGKHVYEKWHTIRRENGDQLLWYADLDRNCRDKLVQRANELYGKSNRRHDAASVSESY